MKCGTTSLHHYLTQHPQIQLPAMKETNFFSGPPDGFAYATGSRRIESLDEYERLFDPAIEARGEACPSYTMYPRRTDCPERIKAIVPDVKLVYVLRDPVARTVSHYHHSVSVERERRSLQDALGDLSDPYLPYTCASLYATQLERYLRHFRQEQLFLVDQADLRTRRRSTLRGIFAFLSVDDSFDSPHFDDEIATSHDRRTYSSLVVLVRRAQASPLQRLPRGLRRAVRRSAESAVTRPLEAPSLADELRSRLEDLYAGDVRRLRQLTGRSFPTWSV